MTTPFRELGKAHLYIALAIYLMFAVLTACAVFGNRSNGTPVGNLCFGALTAISGPFAGGIIRDFQTCCLNFSISLFPYSGLILGSGVTCQLFPAIPRFLRLTIWTLGWLGWFGGGLISFGHALS